MKILITRKLRNPTSFYKVLPPKAKVTEQSFINIKYLDFKIREDISWIFFNGKHAVKAFFKKYEIPKHLKVGCVSSVTSALLEEYGVKCDFVGDNELSTEENAKIFARQVRSNDLVFFPSSDQSAQTFPQALNQNQKSVVVAYSTKINPIKLNETFDYYLFTSPSNVEGFALYNQPKSGCKIIVIGRTTLKKAEKAFPNHKIFISPKSTEGGMLEKVIELAN